VTDRCTTSVALSRTGLPATARSLDHEVVVRGSWVTAAAAVTPGSPRERWMSSSQKADTLSGVS
jgi:hypothetical protein